MKKCIFCAEQIQDDAKLCRYCSRFQDIPPADTSKDDPLGLKKNIRLTGCGWLTLFAGIGCVLGWLSTTDWQWLIGGVVLILIGLGLPKPKAEVQTETPKIRKCISCGCDIGYNQEICSRCGTDQDAMKSSVQKANENQP